MSDQSRPVPRASAVGSIDRDALIELLWDQGAVGEAYHRRDGAEWLADRILALVRPVEGDALRRCSWEDCPGLEKSIPMHEQEEGPELHEVCEAAMISPEAVAELTGLYQQLAQERKDRLAEGAALSPKEALLAAEALAALLKTSHVDTGARVLDYLLTEIAQARMAELGDRAERRKHA